MESTIRTNEGRNREEEGKKRREMEEMGFLAKTVGALREREKGQTFERSGTETGAVDLS